MRARRIKLRALVAFPQGRGSAFGRFARLGGVVESSRPRGRAGTWSSKHFECGRVGLAGSSSGSVVETIAGTRTAGMTAAIGATRGRDGRRVRGFGGIQTSWRTGGIGSGSGVGSAARKTWGIKVLSGGSRRVQGIRRRRRSRVRRRRTDMHEEKRSAWKRRDAAWSAATRACSRRGIRRSTWAGRAGRSRGAADLEATS